MESFSGSFSRDVSSRLSQVSIGEREGCPRVTSLAQALDIPVAIACSAHSQEPPGTEPWTASLGAAGCRESWRLQELS